MKVFFMLLILLTCKKEDPPELITAATCDLYHEDLFSQYNPDVWTQESMLDFLQGKWILDTVICSMRWDPCDISMDLPADHYVTFKGTEVSIWNLNGDILAQSPFVLETRPLSSFYWIMVTKNPSDFAWAGRIYGAVISCQSTLVISTSFLDVADWYYRKLD